MIAELPSGGGDYSVNLVTTPKPHCTNTTVTSATCTATRGGGNKEYAGTIWERMMERARSLGKEGRGKSGGGNKRGSMSQGREGEDKRSRSTAGEEQM